MDAGSQQPANAMDVKAAVNDVVMATTLMRCTDKVLSYKISLDQDACRDESLPAMAPCTVRRKSSTRPGDKSGYAAIARLRLAWLGNVLQTVN